jgi:hypothetical protein
LEQNSFGSRPPQASRQGNLIVGFEKKETPINSQPKSMGVFEVGNNHHQSQAYLKPIILRNDVSVVNNKKTPIDPMPMGA